MKFITAGIVLLLFSCSNSKRISNNQSRLPQWLLGSWQQSTGKANNLREIWIKKNDRELSGKTVKINGADTILLETITILQAKDSLYYIPAVSDQNNGLPVRFYCSEQTDGLLVFENPQHDYPQKITYKKITTDSIVATISGLYKGTPRSNNFYMKR
jgi:hypothetical protein